MKKGIIALIAVGSTLLVAGTALFISGLVIEKMNKEPVVNTYDIREDVNKINIDISTANVEFKVSEDGTSKVICNETNKEVHNVSVANNTLSITYQDNLAWYERWFNIIPYKMSVEIYLPSGNYESVVVRNSTGDITINKEYSFSDVDLKVSTGTIYVYSDATNTLKVESTTGDIHINEVNTKELELKASTGDVNLTKVVATGDIAINTSTGKINVLEVSANNIKTSCSTGKVKLDKSYSTGHLGITTSTGDVAILDSDADTVDISTSTGDVNATFTSDKIVFAETKTGNVDVPHLTSGGLCSIKTTTGDITVKIK